MPAGPLADVVTELVIWLRAKGYAKGTALSVAGTAARLGAWMSAHKLDVDDLDEVVLERFVAAQSRGPHPTPPESQCSGAPRAFHCKATARTCACSSGLPPTPGRRP